jgi:predicted nucleic acid-binding protein
MIVICDTSPICYLLLIEQIQILSQLFTQITIPPAVQKELLAEQTFSQIQVWIADLPPWVNLQPVPQLLDNLPPNLGAGEREAISLAVSLQSNLIILDDWDARQAALSQGLTVTGLLGVLYRAGTQDLLDFYNSINRLQQTSFRASPALIQQFLEKYSNHRRRFGP